MAKNTIDTYLASIVKEETIYKNESNPQSILIVKNQLRETKDATLSEVVFQRAYKHPDDVNSLRIRKAFSINKEEYKEVISLYIASLSQKKEIEDLELAIMEAKENLEIAGEVEKTRQAMQEAFQAEFAKEQERIKANHRRKQ